jgi:hypothetical protein
MKCSSMKDKQRHYSDFSAGCEPKRDLHHYMLIIVPWNLGYNSAVSSSIKLTYHALADPTE